MVDSEGKIIKDNEDKPILFDKDEGKIINQDKSGKDNIVHMTREDLEDMLAEKEKEADDDDEDATEEVDILGAILASLKLLEEKYITKVSATANTVTETSIIKYPTDLATGYTIMIDANDNNIEMGASGPVLYDKTNNTFVTVSTSSEPSDQLNDNVLIIPHTIKSIPEEMKTESNVVDFIDTATVLIESFLELTGIDLNAEYGKLTPEEIVELFGEIDTKTGESSENGATLENVDNSNSGNNQVGRSADDGLTTEVSEEEPSVNTIMVNDPSVDEPEVEPSGDRDCVMGEWREWQETESAKDSLCKTAKARTRKVEVEPMGNGLACGKRIQTKCTAVDMGAKWITDLEAAAMQSGTEAATAAAQDEISKIQERLESKKLELKSAKEQAKKDAEAAKADLEAANKEARAAQKKSADIQAQLDNARERIENKKQMIQGAKEDAEAAEAKRVADIARVRLNKENAAAKLAAATAIELQSALDRAGAAESALANAEADLVKSEAELAKMTAKKEESKAKLQAARSDLASANTLQNRNRVKNLEKQVSQAEAAENSQRAVVNTKKVNKATAKKNKDKSEKDVKDNQKRNKDAKNSTNGGVRENYRSYYSSRVTGMNI